MYVSFCAKPVTFLLRLWLCPCTGRLASITCSKSDIHRLTKGGSGSCLFHSPIPPASNFDLCINLTKNKTIYSLAFNLPRRHRRQLDDDDNGGRMEPSALDGELGKNAPRAYPRDCKLSPGALKRRKPEFICIPN